MTWTIEKWDYSVDSPARQEMLKRMQQMTVVAINYENDSCIFIGDDNATSAAEAEVIVKALNSMHTAKQVAAGELADVIFEAFTGDANWYDAEDAADAVLARFDVIEKVKL